MALHWFHQAAKSNHLEAMFNLALCYEQGVGVEINHRKAFSFYKRAAELGDAFAQCNIGVRYLEGLERVTNFDT